jgi:predicted dehydrogenase
MLFLAGAKPKSARVWLSYANAIAPHRDTHAHLYFEFSTFRSLGSISKTVHGAGNDLEFTIIGTKQAATWAVREPDEIRLSRGNQTSILRRKSGRYGSQQPAFHGLGWLEGYTEIIHDFLLIRAGKDAPSVPTLPENLAVMEVLLTAERM